MEYMIVTGAANAATLSAWNDCLDSADFATYHTSPEFLSEGRLRGREPFAVLAVQGERVHGVVTGFCDRRELTCGESGSPHLCVRRGEDVHAVGSTLAAGLRAHASRSTELISAYAWGEMPGLRAAGFRSQSFAPPLCTILLDLSRGKDWLFRQCSETRRNKIHRAVKAGVQVSEMVLARDFDEYYELYRHWCGFKKLACQPYDVQRSAFELGANRLALVARHDGQMTGVSTFRFRRPGLVEYASNVSRREDSKIRQNDLLLWRGIEWSVEQGCYSHFSMAGAHFFLQKFGGRVHQTYIYRLDRTFLRRRDAADGIRAAAQRLYRSLPEGAKQVAKKLLRRPEDSR